MEDDFAKQVKRTKDEIAELEWQQNVVSLRLKRARKKLKELEGGRENGEQNPR